MALREFHRFSGRLRNRAASRLQLRTLFSNMIPSHPLDQSTSPPCMPQHPYLTFACSETHSEEMRTTCSLLFYLDALLSFTTIDPFFDMALHRLSPVALSRRDGRLVHGFGHLLWMGASDQGPSAMERLAVKADEDISATMMRRYVSLFSIF